MVHHLKIDEVAEKFGSNVQKGLSTEEASERLKKHGPNALPEPPKRPAWKRLLMQFHNVLIYVLIIAAIITALMDHWIDTWVIIGVVIVNAWIGYVQEGKAEAALDSIRNMLSLEALTLRNGKKQAINAKQLAPGDIVLLKAGDKVPADLRLFSVKNAKMEEAALTGESHGVDKQTEPVDKEAVLGDRLNMAFSGTTVSFGEARGMVVATGMDTELGKISQMMSEVKPITTPLLQQIETFGKWLSLIILLASAGFFAFGYWLRDYSVSELFLAVIGLIVAAIPEGLPAIMTITLAIGVQRMARRNAIIRRLPSVETLGSVDVICSDKTGTLTRNEMTAKKVVTTDQEYDITGIGYEPKGDILSDDKVIEIDQHDSLKLFVNIISTTNTAQLNQQDEQWTVTGSPTEGALLVLCEKAGVTSSPYDTIDHIPFSSEHKYAAHLVKNGEKNTIFVTGAPDSLLSLSKNQLGKDGEQSIDKDFWDKAMAASASKGMRLLGAAYVNSTSDTLNHEDIQNLTFVGVAGIIDPPREEAVEAIRQCKRAGVKVKMITGDHALTALAIAKELGIGDGKNAITGAELEKLSDEDLLDVVEKYDVYARTTPEHKLRLVSAMQANGHRCAMTGDGVNDAPALKKANIGVAMGIKGTEVSKDASEMVLADDNFASIVHAIVEGRTVYDNIRKALLFILPTNGAESLVLISAVLMGIVMPITPAQILWVNMVTAVTLALALAFEPSEQNTMRRPPRKANAALLGGLFIWRIIFVSVLIGGASLAIFTYAISLGVNESTARTLAVNTLVAGQLFYLFNCRTMHDTAINRGFFANAYAFYAAAALLALQLLFVYAPFMNTFFDTSPLSLTQWGITTAAGAMVFVVVEAEKYLTKRG
ncbi:MAG: cation-transporting P-type ATPase [Cryomorphaceae bacterium]|nr:cation-transporting P-type ATPase [Cryomorphaceae bacterium]